MAKILLVDDLLHQISGVVTMLEDGGHDVVKAYHGKQGLEVLTQNPDTDLILLDYNMPYMNGFTFSKTVRTDEKYKEFAEIPIIGFGDFPNDEIDYLTRPFNKGISPDYLLENIADLCK